MKTERISLIIQTVTKHPNVISAKFTLKHIFCKFADLSSIKKV